MHSARIASSLQSALTSLCVASRLPFDGGIPDRLVLQIRQASHVPSFDLGEYQIDVRMCLGQKEASRPQRSPSLAEKLKGMGDMLFQSDHGIERLQGGRVRIPGCSRAPCMTPSRPPA